MVRNSSVLTAGKIKFSSPADFVNCLASFRARTKQVSLAKRTPMGSQVNRTDGKGHVSDRLSKGY